MGQGTQYGSAATSNPMRSYGQPSPQFNSQAYTGGQNYFNNRMMQMPGFGPRSYGAFGRTMQPASYQGGDAPPISDPPGPFVPQQPQPQQAPQAMSDPAWVFGKGIPPAQPVQAPQTFDARPAPGNDVMPGVGSPPSAFGVGQAMSQPAQPMQNSLVAQAGANIDQWANPYGFNRQQLGPSFNPFGSPQGGYFNVNQYVPNVGNFRNGLDELARWGQNWNGMANGKVGA